MSRLRAWIRSFFGFSRTETNAFLILLPLMVVLIFSEPIYRFWFIHQPHDFTKEKKELEQQMCQWPPTLPLPGSTPSLPCQNLEPVVGIGRFKRVFVLKNSHFYELHKPTLAQPPSTLSLHLCWRFCWARHEVARTIVCYGYIINKPAVPSAVV